MMRNTEGREKESLVVVVIFLSVLIHFLDIGEHRVVGIVLYLEGENFRVGVLEAAEGTEARGFLDEATEEGIVRFSSAEGIHNVEIVVEGERGVTERIARKGADDS